jgi:branched-chain amino acid transport system ATP-binding protein
MVARGVYDALLKISQAGTTILLVEQNARMALSIAHYGYIMEAGRIVLEGSSMELQENDDVKELYLGVGGEAASPKGWRLYKKRRRW